MTDSSMPQDDAIFPRFESTFVDLPAIPSVPQSIARRIHVSIHTPPCGDLSVTPIVCLHGLGSATSFWTPLWCTGPGQRISKRTTIICIDHDGHGLTDWSGIERGMQGYVDDLAFVIDRLDMPKCTIIGHSMSGLTAAMYAMQHKNKVDRLVLLSPMLTITLPVRQALLARAETIQQPHGRSEVATAVARTGIHPIYLRKNPVIPALVHHLISHTSVKGYATACKALATAQDWDPRELEAVPILILTGDADYLIKEETITEWIKYRATMSCRVLEETGHWGGLESPEAIASALHDFALTT